MNEKRYQVMVNKPYSGGSLNFDDKGVAEKVMQALSTVLPEDEVTIYDGKAKMVIASSNDANSEEKKSE